jgi:acrylyl-CoA reductase (NADPH)
MIKNQRKIVNMNSFKAYRIHEEDGKISARFDQIGLDDLTAGDVVIRAAYSDINYKDALAATGKGRILRSYPLVGGIDVSGEVVESGGERFKPGDKVVVCGCELSETRDGGYAEYVRAPADCVVALPSSLSLFDAMALGTAGFTAALAVDRMEQNGQHPDQGPVVVTGATGGVGSVAIDLLSGCGYEVYAYTGKSEAGDYLTSLGAGRILLRGEVDLGKRPMERAEYGGAVDNLGGEVLTWLTRTVKPFGNIASIGLAASHELNTTVMPFILRGVSLLGINSVICSPSMRQSAWERLGSDLKPRHLDKIVTRTIGLDELPTAFDEYMAGGVTGRTVVTIGGDE